NLPDVVAKRRACRTAWEAWWRQAGGRIDWVSLEKSPRRPGLVLLAGERELWLCGCDGKLRTRLRGPSLARPWVLLPNRHFVGSYESNEGWRIAEWDETGWRRWSSKSASRRPFEDLRKLPSGGFLVLGEELILLLDDEGTELRRQEHLWGG